VGAQGVHPGYRDNEDAGRRSTSVYVPRFRNISAATRDPRFSRGYAYEVYTGRSGWKDRAEAPGIGASFKASLVQPGPWTLWMEGYGETLPRRENRVSLNRDRLDQWGLPTLDIDMTYGPNEVAMRLDMAEQAADIARAGGFEGVTTFNETPIPGAVIHEMGTARMGADPKQSVVNRFNQLHDAPNVFVTDGACMASTACQNPSLTYMALTARACTYAIDALKRGDL
jgi:choline dehydrogenase-like flavoprotein